MNLDIIIAGRKEGLKSAIEYHPNDIHRQTVIIIRHQHQLLIIEIINQGGSQMINNGAMINLCIRAPVLNELMIRIINLQLKNGSPRPVEYTWYEIENKLHM